MDRRERKKYEMKNAVFWIEVAMSSHVLSIWRVSSSMNEARGVLVDVNKRTTKNMLGLFFVFFLTSHFIFPFLQIHYIISVLRVHFGVIHLHDTKRPFCRLPKTKKKCFTSTLRHTLKCWYSFLHFFFIFPVVPFFIVCSCALWW